MPFFCRWCIYLCHTNHTIMEKYSNVNELMFANCELSDIKNPVPESVLPNEISDSDSFIYKLIRKGINKKYGKTLDMKIHQRLEHEIAVIKQNGWADHLILVRNIMKTLTNGIDGCLAMSRGWTACSLVNYILGISRIDPIKYNLPFELFANVPKGSVPTIDIDMTLNKRIKYNSNAMISLLNYHPLNITRDILNMIGVPSESRMDFLDKIPLDDEATLRLFCDADTCGISLFDGNEIREYLTYLQPNSFEELVALNTMYLLGSPECISEYIERKDDNRGFNYALPEMGPVLDETHGLLIYEEQMYLLSKLNAANAKCSDLSGSITLCNRHGEVVAGKYQPLYYHGSRNKKNLSWLIPLYGNTVWCHTDAKAFSKSHSLEYTLRAYQLAYLKAHYPKEFEMVNSKEQCKRI